MSTKVALVGCGQISRAHINALETVQDAQVVAVCDRDHWRAEETATLIKDARAYDNLGIMLENEKPDVVHVLTPPDTHAQIAIQSMQAGCHVLVEKPMALSLHEAENMLIASSRNSVKLCVNHNYLFKPSIRRARALVADGAIGRVVHVNGFYGLSGEASAYGSNAGGSHWAFRLPGGAFTNFLPHLIYLLIAFMGDPCEVAGVTCLGEETRTPTELNVLLQGATAIGTLCVSMRAKPYVKFIDIYGTEGIVHADLVREVCTIHKNMRLPRMLSKVLYNLEDCSQLAVGTMGNIVNVALGKMKSMPEMPVLFNEFYNCIRADAEPPVSGQDGKRVTEVLEGIWSNAPRSLFNKPTSLVRRTNPLVAPVSQDRFCGRILVTGATGFLGRHLVSALAKRNADIVALVRDKSRVALDLEQEAEIVCGDVRDPVSLATAMRDVQIVYHCAAVTTNSVPWKSHYETNVLGTKNILEAAAKAGARRVVHVSSVVVYGLEGIQNSGHVDEATPLARDPDDWAFYLRSKLEADRIAIQFWRECGLAVTILRLGILYGPGGGKSVGKGLMQLGALTLVPGSGNNKLPYTYIDNAVDALLLAAITPVAAGQVYNIVDDPQMSMRAWISENTGVTHDRTTVVPVPPFLLLGVAGVLERNSMSHHATTPPKLSRYVIRSACRDIFYDTCKARQELGWTPQIKSREGLQRMVHEAT